MKFFIIAVIVSIVVWDRCSEKVGASLEVAAERLEDQIVESAGKGRVALKMQERYIAHLRERLVETKTLRKIYERRVDTESQVERLDASKAAPPNSVSEAVSGYASYVEQLKEMESTGEQSLRHSRENYEKLREKIHLLEDRKALLNALRNLTHNVGDGGSDAQELLKQLEQDVLRAEAEFEVAQLDAPDYTISETK